MDNHVFLRAAASLAKRYLKLHFLLSGRDVLLDNKALKYLIPSRVLERFHLLGERSDISKLMSAMDFFCQSSWSEAFPNVLGEAMATAVPCVVTDVGDSAIIVGKTGIVVAPRVEYALANGIENLLTMPLVQLRMLSASARDRIEDNYTLGAIVEQYAELYEKLVAEKDMC